MNVAKLTPAFAQDSQGRIHSVFRGVVNASMYLPSGPRLLTLTALHSPQIPDSILVEPYRLASCEIGMSTALVGNQLQIGDLSIPFVRKAYLPLVSLAGQPRTAEFLAATQAIPSGFDHMPEALRTRAVHALITCDAPGFIGLGLGLTPSYDDACVGVMATYCALGRQAPFVIKDLQATTDVSARYLRLAGEGYFGEPLTQLLSVIFGQGSMEAALLQLLQVGATSGADMAVGVAAALRQVENEKHASGTR
ncbi:MAG: DUF2877 domain-containing protein [Eubacteriales bacterium]|nr:DUF2877 domain-containing protein [Eubacteriales bacterium]